jgi:DNA-binding PadR family transcriptional regulator
VPQNYLRFGLAHFLFIRFFKIRVHAYLGEFELMILLTIIRLGEEVYGVPLARELSAIRGGDVSVGTVYAALDRLELKGLIASTLATHRQNEAADRNAISG